jgi:hypothetical protein
MFNDIVAHKVQVSLSCTALTLKFVYALYLTLTILICYYNK